jgi:transposase
VELSAIEQRYRAVLAVQAGEPTIAVAAHVGVSRQAVPNWPRRYRQGGLAALADRVPAARTGARVTPRRRWRQ